MKRLTALILLAGLSSLIIKAMPLDDKFERKKKSENIDWSDESFVSFADTIFDQTNQMNEKLFQKSINKRMAGSKFNKHEKS